MRRDGGGFALYARDVCKWRCQGAIKRTAGHASCFDSCTKSFVSVTKYPIEQRKEEDVVILAPGCKGPAWDHVVLCAGTEHHGGRSVWQSWRLVYTSRWMKSREGSCQPFHLLSAFLFFSVSVLNPWDCGTYYLGEFPPLLS